MISKDIAAGRAFCFLLLFLVSSLVTSSVGASNLNSSYFVLDIGANNTEFNLVSLVDGNEIRVNESIVIANESELSSISIDQIANGDHIFGAGPFEIGVTFPSSDELAVDTNKDGAKSLIVPESYASKHFVVPQYRHSNIYRLLSPSKNTVVEIAVGEKVTRVDLVAGQVHEVNVGNDSANAALISATSSILLAHSAQDSQVLNDNVDRFSVPAPARELWGVGSGTVIVGALEDATEVFVSANDGSSESFVINSGDQREVSFGEQVSGGSTPSYRVVANKPVNAVVYSADAKALAFRATGALGTSHAIPTDSRNVIVACPTNNTSIQLKVGSTIEETLNCQNQEGIISFGDANAGSDIAAGSIILSDHPVYVHYEQRQTGIELSPNGLKYSYYVLSNDSATQAITLLSLSAGNKISIGANELNLGKYELGDIPAEWILNGHEVIGEGAFDVGESDDMSQLLVPNSYAGNEFVVPSIRGGHKYLMLSPDRTTQVSIRVGDKVVDTKLPAGEVVSVDMGVSNGSAALISSDTPILLAHLGYDDVVSDSVQDAFAVSPPAKDLLGVHSGQVIVAALEHDTQLSVYASDGAVQTYTLVAGEQRVIAANQGLSAQGTGASYRLSANKPIMALQFDDGDGKGASLFSTPMQLNTRYGLANDTQYVAVACLDAGTLVQARNGSQNAAVQICNGSIDTQVPGKAYLGGQENGSHLGQGTVIESSRPVHIYTEPAVSNNEAASRGHRVTTEVLPPVLENVISQGLSASQRITGFAVPGYQVSFYVDGALVGNVEADTDGQIFYDIEANSKAQSVHAIAEKNGEVSLPSNSLSTSAQTSTAARTAIASPIAANSVATNAPSLNSVANPVSSNPYTVTGTATPSADVRFYVNNTLQKTIAAGSDGSFAVPLILLDGANSVYAVEWDGSAESTASNSLNIDYQNTIPREQGGVTISQDTVWTPGSPAVPYDVTSSNLTVADGATLTLTEGTVIRFGSNRQLVVQGKLDLQGSNTNPTLFTSQNSTPAAGNWWGINVTNVNQIHDWSNAVVEYSSNGIYVDDSVTLNLLDSILRFNYYGLRYDPGSAGTIENNTIEDNRFGIYVYGNSTMTSPHIKNNIIQRNAVSSGYGIYLRGLGESIIEGNEISENKYGIYAKGTASTTINYPSPLITNNNIHNNSTYAVYVTLYGDSESVILNATNNWWGTTDVNGIESEIRDYTDSAQSSPHVDFSSFLDSPATAGQPVQGNFLTSLVSENTTLAGNDTYIVLGDLLVSLGATLTIEPGVRLEFLDGKELIVQGQLEPLGTQQLPVVFTTHNSDAPDKGDWKGIRLANTTDSHNWSNILVEHATQGLYVESANTLNLQSSILRDSNEGVRFHSGSGGSLQANLIDNCNVGVYVAASSTMTSPLIKDNIIVNNTTSSGYGVYFYGLSNSVVEGNEISGNKYGVYVKGTSPSSTNFPRITVNRNNITNNSSRAFYTQYYKDAATVVLDATQNWWGSADSSQVAEVINDYNDGGLYTPHVDFSDFLSGPLPGGVPATGNQLSSLVTSTTALAAGETYTVLADLLVPQGVTLVVPAGVRLEFADGYELTVEGEIDIQGTLTEPVVFTSQSNNPEANSWEGLKVTNTTQVHNWSNVLIEYAGEAIYVEDGVTLNLEDSTLQHNNIGIRFDPGSAGKVENSVIEFNIYQGIYVHANSTVTSPLIRDNVIRNNTGASASGIHLFGLSSSVIEGNEIGLNNRGLYLNGVSSSSTSFPTPVVNGNNFLRNTTFAINAYGYYGADPVVLDATGNWWGSTKIDDITKDISAYTSSGSYRPHVDYSNFLDGPAPSGQSVSQNHLPSIISSDTTLSENQTYLALGDLLVPSGVTLTLEPGAQIEFADGFGLEVEGALNSLGTDENRVVFTSQNSSSINGEWTGIKLVNTAQDHTWSHIVVERVNASSAAGIHVEDTVTLNLVNSVLQANDIGIQFDQGSSGKVEDSLIQTNARHGISVLGNSTSASPLIKNNRIVNNVGGSGYGIHFYGKSDSLVQGNDISDNTYGIYARGISTTTSNYPTPVVVNNNIQNNATFAFQLSTYETAAQTVLDATANWWGTTNVAEIESHILDFDHAVVDYQDFLTAPQPDGTTVNFATPLGGKITTNTTIAGGQTYQVLRSLHVPVGVTLTIEPGAILRFSDDQELLVEGELDVNGTEQAPVVFTSANENPVQESWQGINTSSSLLNIDYAIIEYATDGVYFDNASGSITNSVIHHNSNGIYIWQSSSPTITGNVITQNQVGIRIRGTNNDATNPQPVITGNDIFSNIGNDVVISGLGTSSSTVINLSNNWWGVASPTVGNSQSNIYLISSSVSAVDYSQPASGPLNAAVVQSLSVDRYYLSPLFNSVNLTASLSNTMNWSVNVRNQSGALVRSFTGSGAAVNAAWDGRDAASQPVTDGLYNISITTDDGVKSIQSGYVGVFVDGTAPSANFTAPVDGTLLNSVILTQLNGTAIDAGSFANYTIEYGAGANPLSWSPIVPLSTQMVSNGELATWVIGSLDGSVAPVPNGNYTLRLVVTDKAGNVSTDSVSVDIDNFNIFDVTANTQRFNPSQNETLNVSFSIDFIGTVELNIFSVAGGTEAQPIRIIAQSFTTPGAHSLSWNGKDQQGNIVASDGYLYTLTASDGTRTALYDPKDTTTPVLSAGTPSWNFNAFTNNAYQLQLTLPQFGRVRPEITTNGAFSTEPLLPYGEGIWLEAGVHTLFWDGRHPDTGVIYMGNMSVSNIGYLTPGTNSVFIEDGAPQISGLQNHSSLPPTIDIKSDPYLIYLSYGQFTRFHYSLDSAAQVVIKLLAPGVNDFDDPSNILVTNESQILGDHSVEWTGIMPNQNDERNLNQDGVYTFAIKASSANGASTLRKGVLHAFK